MVATFVDAHRDHETDGRRWGVEPICEQPQVAPQTYYAKKSRPPSARAVRDAELCVMLMALWIKNFSVYGKRKLWKASKRSGIDIGREQTARVMREMGIRGATREKKRFTTKSDPAAVWAPDLLHRDFTATGPNERWVTDFTYCSTCPGIIYVALIIGIYSRKTLDWKTPAEVFSEHLRSPQQPGVATTD